ncbi:MAG: hypothetical protein KDE53_07215, partial [Caldilineaceae bacterium]|nr:hypothetical protein [Caldilineaceae bacterium]
EKGDLQRLVEDFVIEKRKVIIDADKFGGAHTAVAKIRKAQSHRGEDGNATKQEKPDDPR